MALFITICIGPTPFDLKLKKLVKVQDSKYTMKHISPSILTENFQTGQEYGIQIKIRVGNPIPGLFQIGDAVNRGL